MKLAIIIVALALCGCKKADTGATNRAGPTNQNKTTPAKTNTLENTDILEALSLGLVSNAPPELVIVCDNLGRFRVRKKKSGYSYDYETTNRQTAVMWAWRYHIGELLLDIEGLVPTNDFSSKSYEELKKIVESNQLEELKWKECDK